jgi:hypothetical protein
MNSILKMESRGFWVVAILLLLPGSAFNPIYTSKDLARLPCESLASRFFYPVEFDADGKILYEDQLHAAKVATITRRDIIIFVHGWDKPAGSADGGYQDFLCRLYRRGVDDQYLAKDQAIVIGVFWPSTILRNSEDFILIKPFSYYIIRARADTIAVEGIQKRLLPAILDTAERDHELRLHIIGHSFGGRRLIKAVSDYFSTSIIDELPYYFSSVNFVLLLPAIEPGIENPQAYQFISKINQGLGERDRVRRIKPEHLRIFNVYSERDWANRILFPISEAFNFKMPYCSIGACGEPSAPVLTVDKAGTITEWKPSIGRIWNVKADSIISSHSDIYKDRIAGLIWGLISAKELTPGDLKTPLSLAP